MKGQALSNGYLPLAPLRHPEPTAVGEIDLGMPLRARLGSDAQSHPYRDQMLLAHLHGTPVAIVHVDSPPGFESPSDLARAIWDQAGERIVAHTIAFGCGPPPTAAAALIDGLSPSGPPCLTEKPPRPAGRAAVILATVGRPGVLERALRSICSVDCADFEVIVVDNRPANSVTRDLLARFTAPVPVRYVEEPRPGLAVARNAGVAAAGDATFVAFTDDDVVVDRDWLTWLLAPFADVAVQAVTGMVMPLALDSITQKRFERYSGFGKGVERETYDLAGHRADDRLLYPYWGGMFGSGNSMAFRRGELVAAAGFDPALGPGTPTGGGEEIAAFTDIILRGGRLVYEPRSLCWHEHRSEEAALRAQVYNYGVGFTATLWRFVLRDRGFMVAAARSVPVVSRLVVHRLGDRIDDRLPADLARLELRGRLLGPWRYEQSRRISKRVGTDNPFPV